MMRAFILAALLLIPASAIAQENAEWNLIYQTLSHPRCSNCHAADEHPRWFVGSTRQYKFHGMNVQRGADGSGFGNSGLRCTTCHQAKNSLAAGGPPGAPNWHLAPREMAWLGKSSAEICAQFKDPTKTNGRDLAALAEHVLNDPLVAWGWAPGERREPAPHSAQVVHDAILQWQQQGAKCPQ